LKLVLTIIERQMLEMLDRRFPHPWSVDDPDTSSAKRHKRGRPSSHAHVCFALSG
jgi:hypothetical protein